MALKIYIDQGHNPVNPNAGAEGNGLREQDLVYTIGQELAEILRGDGNFEVRLSRPTPTTQLGVSNTTSLAARVNDANSWGETILSACIPMHRIFRAHPGAKRMLIQPPHRDTFSDSTFCIG